MDLTDAWEQIRQRLRSDIELWTVISKRWAEDVVRTMLPDEVLQNGGDRRSVTYSGLKQKAIVETAKENALAHPLNEDDDDVAERCIDLVTRTQ